MAAAVGGGARDQVDREREARRLLAEDSQVPGPGEHHSNSSVHERAVDHVLLLDQRVLGEPHVEVERFGVGRRIEGGAGHVGGENLAAVSPGERHELLEEDVALAGVQAEALDAGEGREPLRGMEELVPGLGTARRVEPGLAKQRPIPEERARPDHPRKPVDTPVACRRLPVTELAAERVSDRGEIGEGTGGGEARKPRRPELAEIGSIAGSDRRLDLFLPRLPGELLVLDLDVGVCFLERGDDRLHVGLPPEVPEGDGDRSVFAAGRLPVASEDHGEHEEHPGTGERADDPHHPPLPRVSSRRHSPFSPRASRTRPPAAARRASAVARSMPSLPMRIATLTRPSASARSFAADS